jgi:ribosomal protein L40E
VPRKEDDDWVEDLIKLGIGLLAIYFVGKLMEPNKSNNEQETNCPKCGARIKKWAMKCPVCRTKLLSW